MKILGTAAIFAAVALGAAIGVTAPRSAQAHVTHTIVIQKQACIVLLAASAPSVDANPIVFSCVHPGQVGGGSNTAVTFHTRAVPNIDILAAEASQKNKVDDKFGDPECDDALDADSKPIVDDIHELICSLDVRDGTLDGKYTLKTTDLNGIDLDANMLHGDDGVLGVVGWVDDDTPDAAFKTTAGLFLPALSKQSICFTNNTDQDLSTPGFQTDEDCDGDGIAGDGVVVAELQATHAQFPTQDDPHGPATILVAQDGIAAVVPFVVVGEPQDLKLQTFETALSTGLTQADCPLGGNASDFTTALGRPDKTIMLAKVLDEDGKEITGAILSLESSDISKLLVASSLSASLDLGAFGAGAPDIFCGAKNAGDATITVKLLSATEISARFGAGVESSPRSDVATFLYHVIGPVAKIAVAATPASVNCDGKTTAEVAATVTDAAGNPVPSGTQVTFNVSVLGTANPVVAKADDKGIAKTTITPLANAKVGVPVIVTAGGVSTSVLVGCGAAAAGGAAPGGGTAGGGAAGGGTTGTITGPDTGSGGDAARNAGGMDFPLWQFAALSVAALLAFGGRKAVARIRRR